VPDITRRLHAKLHRYFTTLGLQKSWFAKIVVSQSKATRFTFASSLLFHSR
jgi:hypothetical protein